MINFNAVKPFLEKHGPTILTGLTMIGVAATAYFTHRADTKVCGYTCAEVLTKDIRNEKEIKFKPIFYEEAKKHWKFYIPPVAVGLATMGCAFGANKWHLSKEGALAAAAIMYKTSGEELEKKLSEKFGEEEVKKVKQEIAEAKADKDRPPWEAKRPDKMKIWEPYSKQWFLASQQELLWAEIMINKMICQRFQVTLNDLLKIYGCLPMKDGDKLGWSYDDECYNQIWACGGNLMGNWIGFSPQLVQNDDGSTYFEMDYEVHPNDLTGLE